MKTTIVPFAWYTLIHDFNLRKVVPYNILAQREPLVKKLKKQFKNKEDFAEALRRDFLQQYWSRCEYEMLFYIEDGRIYLKPWTVSFDEDGVDITDNELLDWPAFTKKLLLTHGESVKEDNRTYVKFDIYDQLMFRFSEIADFCWEYRHKYQRGKKEEN